MKPSRIISLLLLLNLAIFVGILVYFLRTQDSTPFARTPRTVETAADESGSAAAPAPTALTVVVTNQLHWAQLESEDYKDYIARLRSIGCPEQTIRDIIIADLDKLLAPELQALYGRRTELRYWHSEEEEMTNDHDPRELARKEREIEKRKADILRELVNADLQRERTRLKGQRDYHERRLAFLPEARRDLVRDLLEKFEEAEHKIRSKELDDGETLNLTERAQLRVLRQQRESELAALLTPPEKQQFELWVSPTANTVRRAFYGMNTTEQEFLATYNARKPFDDKWTQHDPDLLDSVTRAQMERERAQMEQQIQQGLGTERYAEYKRGEDEDWHQINMLASRFKIPKAKAAEAFGFKKVALDYRAAVRNDSSITPEQRNGALRTISRETENALKGVLGDRAFHYYMRTGLGSWIHE